MLKIYFYFLKNWEKLRLVPWLKTTVEEFIQGIWQNSTHWSFPLIVLNSHVGSMFKQQFNDLLIWLLGGIMQGCFSITVSEEIFWFEWKRKIKYCFIKEINKPEVYDSLSQLCHGQFSSSSISFILIKENLETFLIINIFSVSGSHHVIRLSSYHLKLDICLMLKEWSFKNIVYGSYFFKLKHACVFIIFNMQTSCSKVLLPWYSSFRIIMFLIWDSDNFSVKTLKTCNS